MSRPIIVDQKGKKQALHMNIIPSYQTRQFPFGKTPLRILSVRQIQSMLFSTIESSLNQFKQKLKN
jgi:hypothetical protein